MLKIFAVAIAISTGQPIWFGLSDDVFEDQAKCDAQVPLDVANIKKVLTDTFQIEVQINAKCVPKEQAEQMYDAVKGQARGDKSI